MDSKASLKGTDILSWWDLGEHSGFAGDDLEIKRISCGFCGEKGNFDLTQHLERKNLSGKVLNYDTFRCISCGNLTFIFWSASRSGGSRGVHDYKIVP